MDGAMALAVDWVRARWPEWAPWPEQRVVVGRARLRSPVLRRQRWALAGAGTLGLAVVAFVTAVCGPKTPVLAAGYLPAQYSLGAPLVVALPPADGVSASGGLQMLPDGYEQVPGAALPVAPGTGLQGAGQYNGPVLQALPDSGRAAAPRAAPQSKGTGRGTAASGPCLGRATSGFSNGRIPRSALCPLSGAPGHLLRADAARAFDRMTAAYARQFGTPICVTDSYRDRATQVRLRAQKPTLAAVPGTSMHGLGIAVDLCDGVQRFGSKQHLWLRSHAPTYGWQHPAWARVDGSRPEPWHWEYQG